MPVKDDEILEENDDEIPDSKVNKFELKLKSQFKIDSLS